MEHKSPCVVSIESPYNSEDPAILKRNINYAIMAVKDATRNYGNAAYASHLLNTQVVYKGEHCYMSDTEYGKEIEDKYGCGRDEVIEITNALRMKADKIVFYIDFVYSRGMLIAKEIAEKNDIPIEERYLSKEMMNEIIV